MTSILKVDNIKDSANNQAISISSGNMTVAGNTTFTGTVTGDNNNLALLQTVTANNDTTVTVGSSSLFTSTYKIYQIHCINIHPTNNSVEFRCRMSKGGSVITGSEYEYARFQSIHSSSPGTTRGSNSDGIVNLAESLGNASGRHVSGVHTLYNPAGTTFRKLVNFYSASVDVNANFANNVGVYAHEGTEGAIDGMQFFFNGGNIESGIFKLYGVA
jgi:hypothetical protein